MERNLNDEKLLKYLEALEAVNHDLLTALKRCLSLLSQLKIAAQDQKAWQDMLDDINGIIQAGDKLYEKRIVH